MSVGRFVPRHVASKVGVASVMGVALLCAAGATGPSRAARLLDKLPAEDPATVLPRPPATTNAATADDRANRLGAMPAAPVTVSAAPTNPVAGLIWSAVGAVQAVSSAASEALWETAYMFGANSTPVPRTPMADTSIEMTPVQPPAPRASRPAAPAQPAVATAITPVDQAPSPTPVPAPTPVADAPPAPQQPARTDRQTRAEAPPPPAAIDPGLLANFIYDRGERRPDGSFFVPKPLQRLFEVRTQRATSAEVPVTLKMAGRIVPDPQFHGDVESSVIGRLDPPPEGLPVLGQSVQKGEILAFVQPAVGVVDRTQVRRDIARLTTDIRVETENLEILKQFTFVPFRDGKIYQSEQRIGGLRRERDALLPLLNTQEVLRASADGVISGTTAVSGRIVRPGEPVFSITDPQKLWVEASAADPTIADSAIRVHTATAITPEGQKLSLTYMGSGLTLQQQSTPVLFRIDNPPDGLRVGRPLTVSVQSENRSQHGLPITRDALTIGDDGVQQVWEQSAPEVFLPHVVRTQDLDGGNVLVVDGLKEGARVVVKGVRLLAQLQ